MPGVFEFFEIIASSRLQEIHIVMGRSGFFFAQEDRFRGIRNAVFGHRGANQAVEIPARSHLLLKIIIPPVDDVAARRGIGRPIHRVVDSGRGIRRITRAGEQSQVPVPVAQRGRPRARHRRIGCSPWLSSAYIVSAIPSWRRLFTHEMRRPASFALLSAGRSMLARMATIAITTSNSMRPGWRLFLRDFGSGYCALGSQGKNSRRASHKIAWASPNGHRDLRQRWIYFLQLRTIGAATRWMGWARPSGRQNENRR